MADLKIGQININPQNVVQHLHFAASDFCPPSNTVNPKGFVGRAKRLYELHNAWRKGYTAFFIHGAPGVGKTELALKFIDELRASFECHLQIDLKGLENHPVSQTDALWELIKIFKPDTPTRPDKKSARNLFHHCVKQYKTILLLDNAKEISQVQAINRSAAVTIITSREKFTVSGAYSLELQPMEPEEAISLLFSACEPRRFNGKADLVAELGGYFPIALLPLARILAEDLTLSVEGLIQIYSNRRKLLSLRDPNRNLAIQTAFDLSYERLSLPLKELLVDLVVFPSDFDLAAVQGVCIRKAGKAACAKLVKKHLLQYEQESNRFKLHDLLREYLANLLSQTSYASLRELHSIHYGILLSELDSVTTKTLQRFDEELVNIQYGFDWLRTQLEDQHLAALCELYTNNSEIIELRLDKPTLVDWLMVGLEAARRTGNKDSQSHYLSRIGLALRRLGEVGVALEFIKGAYSLAIEIGSKRAQSVALTGLGVLYHDEGLFDWAIELHERAVQLTLDDWTENSELPVADLFIDLAHIASIYGKSGRLREAQTILELAISSLSTMGDKETVLSLTIELGKVHRKKGEFKTAFSLFESSTLQSRELGDQHFEGHASYELAELHLVMGNYSEASRLAAEAMSLCKLFDCDKTEEAERIRLMARIMNISSVARFLGKRFLSFKSLVLRTIANRPFLFAVTQRHSNWAVHTSNHYIRRLKQIK